MKLIKQRNRWMDLHFSN